jgi:dihydrodipicolinate synthase/N-acetylneuraminate lyase
MSSSETAAYSRETGWVRTLAGVVVATLTPFAADGHLDAAGVLPYVDFLVAGGVSALMVGGTTSEFIALTTNEREELIRTAVLGARRRVPVVAHIGHVDLREALHLGEAAARAGADAITSVVPYYHAHTQAAIVEHLRAQARALPHLPFVVYNYPAAAANRLEAEAFADLLDEPNVAGIKLSVATLEEIVPFMRFSPQVCVMSGNDAIWEQFVALGGRAVVSGNAAVVPELTTRLLQAWLDGDLPEARRLTPLLEEVITLGWAGAPGPLKELLRTRGLDLGPARVRSIAAGEAAGLAPPSAELRRAVSWDLSPARAATT